MRPRAGMTLIEILIACGLFSLVLLSCGELAVLGMRSHSQSIDKNQAFRGGTIVLDRLSRDLLHATQVYLPASLPVDADVHPGAGAVPGLVLRTYSSRTGSGETVVGYRHDPASRVLTRTVYAQDFDPADPATHAPLEPPQAFTWIAGFTVRRLAPASRYGEDHLRCTLLTATTAAGQAGPTLTLTTEARLRR